MLQIGAAPGRWLTSTAPTTESTEALGASEAAIAAPPITAEEAPEDAFERFRIDVTPGTTTGTGPARAAGSRTSAHAGVTELVVARTLLLV